MLEAIGLKLTSFTLVLFAASCYFIFNSLRNFRRDMMSVTSTLLWMGMWTAVGVSALFPSLLDSFMRMAQMGNRMFFILLLAVFVILMIIFNLTAKVERLERSRMLLAQELAILRYRIENPSSSEVDKGKDA